MLYYCAFIFYRILRHVCAVSCSLFCPIRTNHYLSRFLRVSLRHLKQSRLSDSDQNYLGKDSQGFSEFFLSNFRSLLCLSVHSRYWLLFLQLFVFCLPLIRSPSVGRFGCIPCFEDQNIYSLLLDILYLPFVIEKTGDTHVFGVRRFIWL